MRQLKSLPNRKKCRRYLPHEVADWKKKHNQLLTEEERKEAERLEAQKNIEAELKSLRRDKTVSDSKAKFIGLGYDAKLAEETASALADGNMEAVFANQQKFIENHDKTLKAQMLNNTPTPGAGNPGNVDYSKKIEEALASGNMADAVYYTTLAQTPTK
jgi:hypothetical protein